MKFYNKNYSRLAGWLLAQPSTENTREREEAPPLPAGLFSSGPAESLETPG